jgi:hypothetical protein
MAGDVRVPETARERAQRVRSAADRTRDRADSMDEFYEAVGKADSYRQAGDWRTARALVLIADASHQLDVRQAQVLDERARVEAERADRVERLRASGQRVAFPELDRSLRTR